MSRHRRASILPFHYMYETFYFQSIKQALTYPVTQGEGGLDVQVPEESPFEDDGKTLPLMF